jgi:hypothetical protein
MPTQLPEERPLPAWVEALIRLAVRIRTAPIAARDRRNPPEVASR